MRDSRPILLVEDDSVDAMAVQRVLNRLQVTNELVHKHNGKEALEYLRTEGDKKPCIILLDLNMPKMNGFEFLKVIRADDELKRIPVVVLTTSGYRTDIVESFELGAAGYMVKVAEYKKLVGMVNTIHMYWTLSELPNGY